MPNSSFLTLVVVLALGRAGAAEIYSWVDDNGVVHFSDVAPDSGVEKVDTLFVADTNGPEYEPGRDAYSILAQAARINAKWTELSSRRSDDRRDRDAENTTPPAQFPVPWYDAAYFAPRSHSVVPHRRIAPSFVPPKRLRMQRESLEILGLDAGRRPHSINSEAHRARVRAGQSLLRRPLPAHPGMPRAHRPARE